MIQAEQEFSILATELQVYRKKNLLNKEEQVQEFDSKFPFPFNSQK
jgi:hypothetical protein